MYYIYDDFSVKETSHSYVVTREIPGEDKKKARIAKDVLKKVKTNDDIEMVAIICAILEFIRFDSKKINRNAEQTLLNDIDFPERLSNFLNTRCIEEAVEELLEKKYFEVKELF